jgi:protocatechuate 3,4-dioxygenase beta subunit
VSVLIESADRPWRRILAGPTDMAAAARVPSAALRPIPEAARASFAPFVERLPGLRVGENDLTRILPGRRRAQGTPMAVSGIVVDNDGRPARGVLVEMWNANRWGRYTHKDDPARQPIDPDFLGYGRTLTDDAGRYQFLTIRPAAYLARPDIDRWRPAHLHFSLRGGGVRLVTQMYFAEDPHLDRDPCYSILTDAQRHRQIGEELPSGGADRDLDIRFDMVVGGSNATMFE